MSKLTDAEIAAKTASLQLLQKELGWVRTNLKPVLIGAAVGALLAVTVLHVL